MVVYTVCRQNARYTSKGDHFQQKDAGNYIFYEFTKNSPQIRNRISYVKRFLVGAANALILLHRKNGNTSGLCPRFAVWQGAGIPCIVSALHWKGFGPAWAFFQRIRTKSECGFPSRLAGGFFAPVPAISPHITLDLSPPAHYNRRNYHPLESEPAFWRPAQKAVDGIPDMAGVGPAMRATPSATGFLTKNAVFFSASDGVIWHGG